MREVPSDRKPLRLSWSGALRGAELYDGENVGTFATDWHFHEGCQLVAVTRGERHYEFKSSRIVARPGQLVFVPPRFVHRAHCVDGASTSFRIATLPAFNHSTEIPLIPVVLPTSKLFDSFISLFESLKPYGENGSNAAALGGLEAILRESGLAANSQTVSPPAFVMQIESYLTKSLKNPPSLSSLSSLAGVSSYHLAHAFTKHVGLSPLAFHVRARLMRSRKSIAQGRSLAETSLSLSFSDQSHFGRQFRRVYGMTPGEYKRSLVSA